MNSGEIKHSIPPLWARLLVLSVVRGDIKASVTAALLFRLYVLVLRLSVLAECLRSRINTNADVPHTHRHKSVSLLEPAPPYRSVYLPLSLAAFLPAGAGLVDQITAQKHLWVLLMSADYPSSSSSSSLPSPGCPPPNPLPVASSPDR